MIPFSLSRVSGSKFDCVLSSKGGNIIRFQPKAILIALTASLALTVLFVSVPFANNQTERLANGSFEEGFGPDGVGIGWGKFDNGGGPNYVYWDDTWAPVVHGGCHSQGIEIDTKGKPGVEADRYAGIYQTVAVVPDATYEFSFHGMMRVMDGDPGTASYGYRIQYGVDYNGGTDWTAVPEWFDVGWNDIYPRTNPGEMLSYSASITATSDTMTIFIRAWKKWPVGWGELDVNLDSISLKGTAPEDTVAPTVEMIVPSHPTVCKVATVHVSACNGVGVTTLELYDDDVLVGSASYEVGMLHVEVDFAWHPTTSGDHTLKAIAYDAAGGQAEVTELVAIGEALEFIANGSFEEGFGPDGVGIGWGKFDNGGKPNYIYWDDTWAPVVYDGCHSQGIEIDTKGKPGVEADRYAGIYQTISGLTPGATYQFSFHGMMRVMDGDPGTASYGYRIQCGVDYNGGTDWTAVTEWFDVGWNDIYPRTNPGEMRSYSASITATSDTMTIFIRAWKKWPVGWGELDVNLDSISLTGYTAP